MPTRWGGQMYKLLMSNFLRIQHAKNHWNRLIFHRIIWKRWTFFGTQCIAPDEHGFCTVCSVDISVSHGGRQDITTPPCSSLIINADLPNFMVIRLTPPQFSLAMCKHRHVLTFCFSEGAGRFKAERSLATWAFFRRAWSCQRTSDLQ